MTKASAVARLTRATQVVVLLLLLVALLLLPLALTAAQWGITRAMSAARCAAP